MRFSRTVCFGARLARVHWLLLVIAAAGCNHADSGSSSAAVTHGDPVATDMAAGEPWFDDVTSKLGVDFVHDAGKIGSHFMPEMVGSGAALFDYDDDGRLDLYLLQNGGPDSNSTHRLYHQEPDGHFRDVSAGSGLDLPGYGMGVSTGDVNNDGRIDVVLTEYGRVRLLVNLGNGKFIDATTTANLENPQWGTSAAMFDYDRDGRLDLVVVNYVEYSPSNNCFDHNGRPDYCGPKAFQGTVARLFHNVTRVVAGSSVAFEDVTVSSGLARRPGPGLGVVTGDFSGDRWPDILVANDGMPNHLWINQRDGTFHEEGVERGIAFNRMGLAEANMGIAVGDIDGNELMDVIVTHLTEETNTLWAQGPPGMFQDQTATTGLLSAKWRGTGFGTVLADFNADGQLDLAIANGRVRRDRASGSAPPQATVDLGDYWSHYGDRNQLLAGLPAGKFTDISTANDPFCGRYHVARALACGDLDNDGAIDLVVTNVAGPVMVLQNVAPRRGHWLIVRAVDPALRRDAYGAEIDVRVGQRHFKRWVSPSYSFTASNDPRAHFGLGDAAAVDSIHMIWPDGAEETFAGRATDQIVVLERGTSRQSSAAEDREAGTSATPE